MVTTPDAIRETLIQKIVGADGGEEAARRAVIADVEVLFLTMNPTCNWRVTLRGAKRERTEIEIAVKLLREAHPCAILDLS